MSKNAIGTIIIASELIISLLIGWFLFSTFTYYILTTIFNMNFSIFNIIFVFITILGIRAFYPKNVFL